MRDESVAGAMTSDENIGIVFDLFLVGKKSAVHPSLFRPGFEEHGKFMSTK